MNYQFFENPTRYYDYFVGKHLQAADGKDCICQSILSNNLKMFLVEYYSLTNRNVAHALCSIKEENPPFPLALPCQLAIIPLLRLVELNTNN